MTVDVDLLANAVTTRVAPSLPPGCALVQAGREVCFVDSGDWGSSYTFGYNGTLNHAVDVERFLAWLQDEIAESGAAWGVAWPGVEDGGGQEPPWAHAGPDAILFGFGAEGGLVRFPPIPLAELVTPDGA